MIWHKACTCSGPVRLLAIVMAVMPVGAVGADIAAVDLYSIADAGGQYWKDITGTEYSEEFQSSFSYTNASATLAYHTYDDAYFRASLGTSGLKPDFCYQIKFTGKPEAYWAGSGDDLSNEALGYAGRWWREEPNPANASDSDYEAHKDDPAYVYTGYLLFESVVTDENGDVNMQIISDSSYHVVWKTSQRTPQANDGPVRDYLVNGTSVSLYSEWEPTRALPGELMLRPGGYDVRFVLTEESFHDPGASWATVMACDDVSFDIAPEPSTIVLVLIGIAAMARRRRQKPS